VRDARARRTRPSSHHHRQIRQVQVDPRIPRHLRATVPPVNEVDVKHGHVAVRHVAVHGEVHGRRMVLEHPYAVNRPARTEVHQGLGRGTTGHTAERETTSLRRAQLLLHAERRRSRKHDPSNRKRAARSGVRGGHGVEAEVDVVADGHGRLICSRRIV